MSLITLSVEGLSGNTGEVDNFISSICSAIRLLLRDQCLKGTDEEPPEHPAIFGNVLK